MNHQNIVVLMGGRSTERSISLLSGSACAQALEQAGLTIHLIDSDGPISNLITTLTPPPDAVFNALHGSYGEDGHIQGLLDLMAIPYTHSGMLASALAMDKVMAKKLFMQAGICCPEGLVISAACLGEHHPLDPPYVIKPRSQGSSLGVMLVSEEKSSPPALSEWDYGDDVIIEHYIAGQELTVTVLGEGQAAFPLAVTEICPRYSHFLDYRAKYHESEMALHTLPARIPKSLETQVMSMATDAHRVLGCRGISRSDFRLSLLCEQLYLLEVNTHPGMTAQSLVPEQAEFVGLDLSALCLRLLEDARCDG